MDALGRQRREAIDLPARGIISEKNSVPLRWKSRPSSKLAHLGLGARPLDRAEAGLLEQRVDLDRASGFEPLDCTLQQAGVHRELGAWSSPAMVAAIFITRHIWRKIRLKCA